VLCGVTLSGLPIYMLLRKIRKMKEIFVHPYLNERRVLKTSPLLEVLTYVLCGFTLSRPPISILLRKIR